MQEGKDEEKKKEEGDDDDEDVDEEEEEEEIGEDDYAQVCRRDDICMWVLMFKKIKHKRLCVKNNDLTSSQNFGFDDDDEYLDEDDGGDDGRFYFISMLSMCCSPLTLWLQK